jgi:hypothetical protein
MYEDEGFGGGFSLGGDGGFSFSAGVATEPATSTSAASSGQAAKKAVSGKQNRAALPSARLRVLTLVCPLVLWCVSGRMHWYR